MIKYFIKRILQDWGEDLGFIAFWCCLILVIFINMEILKYIGLSNGDRGADCFWGVMLLIPEGFTIYFITYLSGVYDDYKKKQINDYCYKIKSGGENNGTERKD